MRMRSQEERDSFAKHLVGPLSGGGCALVDSLRAQHPEVEVFTYYGYRFNCRYCCCCCCTAL